MGPKPPASDGAAAFACASGLDREADWDRNAADGRRQALDLSWLAAPWDSGAWARPGIAQGYAERDVRLVRMLRADEARPTPAADLADIAEAHARRCVTGGA
jgi:hypothetical protein